jgi:hypothetical protein
MNHNDDQQEENYFSTTSAVGFGNDNNLQHKFVGMGGWEIEERFLQDDLNGTDVFFEDTNTTDTNSTSTNTTTPPDEDEGGADGDESTPFPVESPTTAGGDGMTTPAPVLAPSSSNEFFPTDTAPTSGEGFEPPAPTALQPSEPTIPAPTSAFQPSAPTAPTSSFKTDAPTPTYSSNSAATNNPMIGLLVVIIVAIVGVFVGWRLWKNCQARRERHMLRIQSTRVDAALGDLQVRIYRGAC